MARIVLFNKPFNVLSQFSDDAQRATLKDYIQLPGVYPAGRLDRDSEGLLLLTDDGRLQQAISDPRFKQHKDYLVQVEGEIDAAALSALRSGVTLKDGPTLPASAEAIDAPALWPREPPIRVRKSVPDSWLRLSIREGRNRQVRRMTAAVGFPTLRLVRERIGLWSLDGLQPGEYRILELDAEQLREIPGYRQKPAAAQGSKRSGEQNRKQSRERNGERNAKQNGKTGARRAPPAQKKGRAATSRSRQPPRR